MSLKLTLDQGGHLTRKAVDHGALQGLCGPDFCLGSLGQNYAFSAEAPQPGEDGGTTYVLYGAGKPLGRGFVVAVAPGEDTVDLISPLPTTGHDLDDAFAFAVRLAAHLGVGIATEEGEVLPPAGVDAFRDVRKLDNCLMIKDFAEERPGFAVSGVKYPLHMTAEFCGRLAGLDPQAAEKAFSEVLARRQAADHYYMYPNYYRSTETGRPMGLYALNDGVDSIIPKEPFIPYGAGPFEGTPVDTWQVVLTHGGEVLATLPYAAFLAALRPEETQDYDDVHLLLKALPAARLRQLAAGAEKTPLSP